MYRSINIVSLHSTCNMLWRTILQVLQWIQEFYSSYKTLYGIITKPADRKLSKHKVWYENRSSLCLVEGWGKEWRHAPVSRRGRSLKRDWGMAHLIPNSLFLPHSFQWPAQVPRRHAVQSYHKHRAGCAGRWESPCLIGVFCWARTFSVFLMSAP